MPESTYGFRIGAKNHLIFREAASLRDALQPMLLLQPLCHRRRRQNCQDVGRRNFARRCAVRLDDAEDDLGEVRVLEAVDAVDVNADVRPVAKSCRLQKKMKKTIN